MKSSSTLVSKSLINCCSAVLRIRDVYPGSLFLPIPDPGSKNSNKREGEKKIVVMPFFVATNFKELKIIVF
jgi:hypothetical protein